MAATKYKTAAGRKCAATMRRRNERSRAYLVKLHRNLRRVWKQRGYSLKNVSARADLPMRQVERYYHGPIPLSGPWRMHIDHAFALCHALRCELVDLTAGALPARSRAQVRVGDHFSRRMYSLQVFCFFLRSLGSWSAW